MPYPNEHAARLHSPNYDEYRRTNGGTIYGSKKVPSTIDIIWGHNDGEPTDAWHPQALRFPTKTWTASEAKQWLKDNEIKYISFEEASKAMNESYLTKDTSGGSVKDIDQSKGIITGYFSIFGNKDSDGDIILPGAFKKSIEENGPNSNRPRILHLLQHDVWRPLSKPFVLQEDSKGLYFESKISDTSYGRDALKLYHDGVLTEHSIGFNIVRREVDEAAQVQKLVELKLWEGSTVSWGANMEALVQDMKSMDKEDIKDKLDKKMKALQSAVRNNYTDETAIQLEIQLKQIQQLIASLFDVAPDSTQHENEPMTAFEAKRILFKTIL